MNVANMNFNVANMNFNIANMNFNAANADYDVANMNLNCEYELECCKSVNLNFGGYLTPYTICKREI